MEALSIWDPFGLPMLDSTDMDSNVQAFPPPLFSWMCCSMHGPVQAMSYFGSNSPHVPEESGDDSLDIDVNRHPQSEVQTSRSSHVIHYAPPNTLLISCDPLLLLSEGSELRSLSADSAHEGQRPNDLKIVPYRHKGPKMKTKRETNRCHAYRLNALLRDEVSITKLLGIPFAADGRFSRTQDPMSNGTRAASCKGHSKFLEKTRGYVLTPTREIGRPRQRQEQLVPVADAGVKSSKYVWTLSCQKYYYPLA